LDGGLAHREACTHAQDSTTQKNGTHIQASSGIWTHDPNVRELQENTRLKLRGHWDRPK